jgi:23S rRNA pseudouridine1911/1915/1917 synthase
MSNKEKHFIQVPSNLPSVRIDLWLSANVNGLSRSQIKKMILVKQVLVDSKPCSVNFLLSGGEKIEIKIVPALDKLTPCKMDLDIVYEDSDIVVINKPAGVVVHPGAGTDATPTLVQGVLYHCKTLSDGSDAFRPGVVHRLDKDTSGLIVFAKNNSSHKNIVAQFADKKISREYYAILDSFMEQEEIVVEGYIARDPKNRTKFLGTSIDDYAKKSQNDTRVFRYSKSLFIREKTYENRLSLVRVKIFSGRTHQIRVHAAQIVKPVLGDPLYNRKKMLPNVFSKLVVNCVGSLNRQMLHAHKLEFSHPRTGENLCFNAPLAKDFSHVLDLLSSYCD